MATPLQRETFDTLANRLAHAHNGVATIAPNTTATYDPHAGGIAVYLWGNHIATLTRDGRVRLTDGGWPTQTTARRLRALAPDGWIIGVHDGVTMAYSLLNAVELYGEGAVLAPRGVLVVEE